MSEDIYPVVVQGRPHALEFAITKPKKRTRLKFVTYAAAVTPIIFADFVWGIAATAASVVAWFAIVFTGQYPSGLFDFNARAWRFLVTSNAYGMLLVNVKPRYSGVLDPAYPVRADVTRLPEYNRLLTAFRFPLLIPFYLFYMLALFAAYIAAIPSIVTLMLFGRQPASLYRVIAFAMRVYANFISSMFLLTEILWISD
jgi:hypothetical protein